MSVLFVMNDPTCPMGVPPLPLFTITVVDPRLLSFSSTLFFFLSTHKHQKKTYLTTTVVKTTTRESPHWLHRPFHYLCRVPELETMKQRRGESGFFSSAVSFVGFVRAAHLLSGPGSGRRGVRSDATRRGKGVERTASGFSFYKKKAKKLRINYSGGDHFRSKASFSLGKTTEKMTPQLRW